MTKMHFIQSWLSASVTLNLWIILFTVASEKVGAVNSTEQPWSNSSDVQASFFTDTVPASSVLHASTIFHGQSSDDYLNSTTIMTTTVNSELESSYDVINTSLVTASSNSISSPATINVTGENTSVNESSESSLPTTRDVHSSIYSTKMLESVSTSFESLVVSQETQLDINSTIITYDYNNYTRNASSPIVTTEQSTSMYSDSNTSSSVREHFSISTTGEYTVPPSTNNFSSSEFRSDFHSQEPEISASITTAPILSEIFNTDTIVTENVSDTMTALKTSLSSFSSVETTTMYQLNQTEQAALYTRMTTLLTDDLREVINTSSDVFEGSSFESVINNESFTKSYEDTVQTTFSSPIVSTSSFNVTSSLLDLNMSSSTSEEHPDIQSTMSDGINKDTYVSTTGVSSETQSLNISDVSESLLSSNAVSSTDSNVMYASTQLTDTIVSSTHTNTHLTDSFLSNTFSSLMVSATESSGSTTSNQSSSAVPTDGPTSASSFVTSEPTDGSVDLTHLSTSTSSDTMTTTPPIVSSSDEGFKNETGSEGDILARVMITFDGNCRILRDNIQLQEEFLKAWTEDVGSSTGLEIDTDELQMEEILCDPFRVILLLVANDSTLMSSVTSELFSSNFNVKIPDSVRELNFSSTNVEILDIDKVVDGHDDIDLTSHLDVTDYVIIGIASLLFAVLLCMLCIVMCRECYIRQRSSSFSLSEIPHINLKLSDFTLTKIPRPQVIYRENSKRKPDRVPITRIGPMSRHNGHVDGQPGEHQYGQLNINADKIQVRMRDHAHGLVVGVMCSAPTSGKANGSSLNGESKKSLLKEKKCVPRGGLSNPSFSATGEEVNDNTRFSVHEDEIEHFL